MNIRGNTSSIRLLVFTSYLVLLSLFCGLVRAQHKVNIVHYSTKDGLSHDGVLCITRDRDGFMWFGTFDGINRFDGHNFVVYKSRPGDSSPLRTNKIRKITEDQKGNLWIQTFDYKVFHFDKRTEQFWAIADGIYKNLFPAHVIIDRVVVDPVDGVWLLTKNGGMYYTYVNSNGHPAVERFNPDPPTAHNIKGKLVRFICFDGQNRIWVGSEGGLNCLRRDRQDYHKIIIDAAAEQAFPKAAFTSGVTGARYSYFGTADGNLLKFDEVIGKISTTPITNVRLNNIFISKIGQLYISTEGKGVYRFDTSLNKVDLISRIAAGAYLSATEDGHSNIWIEPKDNGVVRYNQHTGVWKYYEQQRDFSSASREFKVQTDADGTVWVGLKGGGFGYYNDVTDKIDYLFDKPNSTDQLFSNVVYCLYLDKTGIIWMSAKDGGVNKIIPLKDKFKFTPLTAATGNRSANDVRAMMKDREGRLWACTKEGEVYVLDHDKRMNVFAGHGNHIGYVYSIIEDSKGNVWLGTKGDGLFKATPADAARKSYALQNYRHKNDDINSLSNDQVYSVVEDSKQRIWIGTLGGGINLFTQSGNTGAFRNYQNTFHNYPYNWAKGVRYLCEDNRGNMWVATSYGLLAFNVNGNIDEKCRFVAYQKKPGDPGSLSNNSVQHIYLDRRGQLWVGTFGGGLDKVCLTNGDITRATFKSYTVANGLLNDVVLSITGDHDGNLWIATAGGLSKFTPADQSFKNYDSFDGLPDAQLSESTCFTAADGYLYFGCNAGYISFNPKNITRRKVSANMALTHIQLYYKEILPGDKHSPLKSAINETKTLTLNHDQNVISIDYAVLDYRAEKEVSYSYKLAGFDTDWHKVNDQQKATYTNIPPGTYTFYVKGVNDDLFYNQPQKSIQIVIKPPFYLTIWARIGYVILTIVVILVTRNISVTMIRLRNKVQVERKLTEIKLAFFTNISHELRTPLTLIASPLEELAKIEELSEKGRQYFKVINRNVSRMIRFTNQLLDFRKVQSGKIQLKIVENDLVALAHNVGTCFATIAAEKNISFDVSSNYPVINAWFDEEKIEIILYNLLSNAFKFSPSGKPVKVEIKASLSTVELRVIDQGKGVPPQKLKEIFEIYHEDNHNKENHLKGTGIGLALAKGLALSHHASLDAEINEYGGLTVVLKLKSGYAHFSKEDLIVAESIKPLTPADPASTEPEEPLFTTKTNNTAEAPLLLIVEDNPDLRAFLSVKLSNNYRVQAAQNGQEGLAMALQLSPDLIISDVLMPRMDGIQMLDELKNDQLTSHIPVILLTAKSSVESRLQGLKYGADIYMTKPFHNEVLMASIDNLLKLRKKLFERIAGISAKTTPGHEPTQAVATSKDEEFLKEVIQLVEEKMTDPNFNIDDIAVGIGMGRTTFYKKLKSLTSLSPVEFVRELRLKQSKKLLDAGTHTITEAAYASGFNSVAYFSTCFKEKYAMSPSLYLKKLKDPILES
jgi:ligand-binding sensor domain-containing protein/signal transduction histidine kinase/DNA-binding response OmpR family regulator